MHVSQALKEIEFIRERTLWLSKRPRDGAGKLLRAEDRAEASMLIGILEDLETLLGVRHEQ